MGPCSGMIGRWLPPVLAIALVSSAGAARAQSIDVEVAESELCLRGGITRVLELREGPDGGLPCEVVYLKPDEDGSSRVMWLARNDRGFCTARFESFLIKLETKLAWECEPRRAADVTEAGTDGAPAPPEDVASRERSSAGEVSVARAPISSPRIDTANGVASPSGDRVAVPALSRALPEPMTGGVAERMAALRELIPSGPYRLVSEDDAEANGGPCPPGGSFFWNTRDPHQPVFEMGPTAELSLMLPAEIDERLLRAGEPRERGDARSPDGSTVPDGSPDVRTLALDGTRSDGQGRTIELRVKPAEEGGTGVERVCRYALGG